MKRTEEHYEAGSISDDDHAPARLATEDRDYEAVFLEHLAYIEHVVSFIVRRHALDGWDAQDFDASVKLRLIQNDYAVLRKFKGQSKLTTFLTTVIHNLHRDFRIQRWGKWRASAAAKRQGEVGVQLESLLYRDGFCQVEAVRLLRENYGVEMTTVELEAMAAELRPRFSRRFETEEALVNAVAAERTDTQTLERENTASWLSLLENVRLEMGDLEPEDRVILRMRFEDGLAISAIARQLGLDQRRLYGRVDRLLRRLRKSQETHTDPERPLRSAAALACEAA